MDDLPDDPQSRIGYRIAYGEAARLLEIANFDDAHGRDFARHAKREHETILAEVERRLHPEIDADLIKLAVEDLTARRRPRW